MTERAAIRALIVIVGAFVLMAMGSTLIGKEVFLGVDAVVMNDPWRSELLPPGHVVDNPCIGDTINALTPARAEFRNRLYQGDFALWEPLGVGGSPLASTPTLGSLSPLNLPHVTLPLWLAPATSKILELTVSIGFMYLFLRRIRLSKTSAIVGGLVFSTSGFLVVWTNWNQAHVAALIPALFWAGERYVQLRTTRSALPVAAVAAVMLAEGFPSVTGYAVAALLPYLIVRVLAEDRRVSIPQLRTVIGGVGAVGLGAGILAVQLVPFLAGLDAIGEGRNQNPDDHLAFSSLVSLGIPRAFGPEPSCRAIEESAYVGAGALVLIVVALARPRSARHAPGCKKYFVVTAALTIVLGWVGGPLLALAQTTPLFGINPVGRIRSLFGFLLAVLAAFGYDSLTHEKHTLSRRGSSRFRLVCAASALAVGAGGWEVWRRKKSTVEALDHLGGDLTSFFALALVACLGAFAAWRLPGRRQQLGAIAIVICIGAQGGAFARWFWPRADRAFFYPRTTVHHFLGNNLGHDRFAAADPTMTPGTPTFYGLRSVTGRAFTATRWAELLRSADPNIFKSPTYSSPGPAAVFSPAFDRLGVRYFVTANGPPQFGQLDTGPAGEAAMEMLSGQSIEAPVPAGRLRGMGLTFVSPPTAHHPVIRLDVTVVDEYGRFVASGFRRVDNAVPAGTFVVPVGPELASERRDLRARFTLHGATALVATVGGAPVVPVTRSQPDGLRLAFSGGAQVWERMTGLPRIRWGSRARIIPSDDERVRLLVGGALKRDELVLDRPGPAADGLPANLTVEEDSGDSIRVRVEAAGSGYLVVSDALQKGWVGELDGRPVPLHHADHALVAISVPSGSHVVTLRYSPPGWRLGAFASALSLGVAILAWWVGGRKRAERPSKGQT